MSVNEDSHRPPGVRGRFASESSYNVPLQAVDHRHAEIIPPRPDTFSVNTTHRAVQQWQAAGRPGEQVALAPDIGARLNARQLRRIAQIDKINKSALPSFPLHQAPQSTRDVLYDSAFELQPARKAYSDPRSSRADVATQLWQVESYLQVVLLRVKDWLPQRLWIGAEPVQDSRLKGNSLMKALATMLVAFAVFDISDEESEAVAALALRVYVCLSGLCEPSAEFFKSWLIHSAKSHFAAAWQLEVPTSIPNIQDKNLVKESLPRALGAVAFSTHLALSNEIWPSHWFSECVHILIDRVTCIEQLKALSKMTTIGGETLFDATTARDILLELNRGLPKLPELDDAANLWNDQNASALIRVSIFVADRAWASS
ncbi:hypothetical protein WOLCODRAFT_24054 [Wolfiporia cocos MD-104 SS10]|uniref:Uncharacterized protein n=1 Tax=Wolfiporia cocos (strain MD-104) TaxID=742152 RepID=A0A2H3JFR3_WOLCO|nr:hypothetical protein WOLCODRAFT_24054 [Wolfiporia cocos MD-104 SS10]